MATEAVVLHEFIDNAAPGGKLLLDVSSNTALCRRGIPNLMTRTLVFLLAAVLIQPAAAKAGPWKSLFDGKSMNAWRIF